MAFLNDTAHRESESGTSTPQHAHSSTVYGSALARQEIPRFELPEDEMPARHAYHFIKDELLLDGTPQNNLASFVTTSMEEEAEELMKEQLSKNFIDAEEYPSTAEIESRCVHMIARLFNAPPDESVKGMTAMGVSTIGSSEAIILAVLAAKRRWKNKRLAEGKDTSKPNIVMNAAVQVCWEKAARYLEVEERYWYCTNDRFVIDPKEAAALVDENTILVCGILGTTYTGQYEDISGLNDALEKRNKELGLDVRIHVDAASGGFVAPFVNPNLLWDFRVPLVCSINTSGHKYGMSYAGVGWALWRSKEYLPDELLFTINYLGAPQISFTLNFSKSSVQVIGQYYQFLRLGKAGYRAVMENLTVNADYLAESILSIPSKESSDEPRFELLSDRGTHGLPLVAFRLRGEHHFDEFAVARQLKVSRWVLPAYQMAPNAEKTKLLRVVVRSDFARHRIDAFIRDLKSAIKFLDDTPADVLKHLATHPHAAHRPKHHEKKSRGVEDKHSLHNKHGKTNGVC